MGTLTQISHQRSCKQQSYPSPKLVDMREALKLMHTLHSDPEGKQETHVYFDSFMKGDHENPANEGRWIIRKVMVGNKETINTEFHLRVVAKTNNPTKWWILQAQDVCNNRVSLR